MVETTEARSQEELDAAAQHNNKDIDERMENSPGIAAIKKQLEVEDTGLAENMERDPRFQEIRRKMIADWEGTGQFKRDILSDAGQDFIFGDPSELRRGGNPQTLDQRVAKVFTERYPELARAYTDQEKIRIYDDPSRDPAIRSVEGRITNRTSLDTEKDSRLNVYRYDNRSDLAQRNRIGNSAVEWDRFIREYPEKAAGYRGKVKEIDDAFRFREHREEAPGRPELQATPDTSTVPEPTEPPAANSEAPELVAPAPAEAEIGESEKEDAEDVSGTAAASQASSTPVVASPTVEERQEQQQEDEQGIADAKAQIDTLPEPATSAPPTEGQTANVETPETEERVEPQSVETQVNPEKPVEQEYGTLRNEWLAALVDVVPDAEDYYAKQMTAYREQRAGKEVATPMFPETGQAKMRRVAEARTKMNQFFQEHPDYADTVNERLKENDGKLKKLAARFMYVRFGPEVLALSPLARDADVTGLREGNEDQLRQISQEIQTLKDDPDYKVRELTKYLREPSKKYAERLEEERKDALERSRIN